MFSTKNFSTKMKVKMKYANFIIRYLSMLQIPTRWRFKMHTFQIKIPVVDISKAVSKLVVNRAANYGHYAVFCTLNSTYYCFVCLQECNEMENKILKFESRNSIIFVLKLCLFNEINFGCGRWSDTNNEANQVWRTKKNLLEILPNK